ncbi:TPA: DUF3560 domain-containing protein [Burkholderia cepacia]
MNDYEKKQEAKRDRLRDRARSTRTEAAAIHERAHRMADAIPFGQPILVGHHSEGRDRRYRAKIHSTFGRAFEKQDEAAELDRRADAVGTGGISSDDPDAIAKLTEKLNGQKAAHERMKKANVCVRRGDRAGLAALQFSEKEIEELFNPKHHTKPGFPAYAFTNSNGRIRDTERRIAELEKIANREDREESGQGYTYREDVQDNRAMFIFDAKPAEEVRQFMRRHSFLYSPSRSPVGKSAYVRKLTPNTIATARYIRPQLDALLSAE